MTRPLVVLGVVLICVVWPGVAHADAATPTDFRTTVVAVTPTVPGLEVTIEGGDSFVRLRAPDGSEVVVIGYAGEPYLRFGPDGTVSENRRSPATYENQRRFGGTELPDFVDASAPPDWMAVGGGGVWAWHDHRSHWMGSEPPIGLEPGASLPVQTIPLMVDGRPVAVAVQTSLVAGASRLPTAFGVLIGVIVVVLGRWLGPATATLGTLLVAVAAVVVGGGQYLSLPAETGPMIVWVVLPAVAVLACVAAISTYGRSPLLVHGALALAGSQLAIWGFTRRDVLTHPVLPTDLAFWFDRAVTGASLVTGVFVLALAVLSLTTFNPQRDPTPRRSLR